MLNVICLKHGTKYGPEYVNNLYNMIERNLTIPHRFVCFTDSAIGLNKNIELILLPNSKEYAGWWWKPYVFKAGHFPVGDTNFFIDLDMVIISNIDKLFTYNPGQFMGLEDVSRVFKKEPTKLGSAVLRWESGQFEKIWTTIKSNPSLMTSFRGDQDLIWHLCKNEIKFYPNEWIRSYKWEVRTREELVRLNKDWVFNCIRNPEVHPETAILAFHGTPNPHQVYDPIIVDNWR